MATVGPSGDRSFSRVIIAAGRPIRRIRPVRPIRAGQMTGTTSVPAGSAVLGAVPAVIAAEASAAGAMAEAVEASAAVLAAGAAGAAGAEALAAASAAAADRGNALLLDILTIFKQGPDISLLPFGGQWKGMFITMDIICDMDDVATEDDLKAHRIAMEEYANGETTAHDDINWD